MVLNYFGTYKSLGPPLYREKEKLYISVCLFVCSMTLVWLTSYYEKYQTEAMFSSHFYSIFNVINFFLVVHRLEAQVTMSPKVVDLSESPYTPVLLTHFTKGFKKLEYSPKVT